MARARLGRNFPGSGIGGFDLVTDGPSTLGRLNAGLQWGNGKNLDIRPEYALQYGSHYWSQSLSARLVYRF